MEDKAFSWFSLLPFYREEYYHIYGSLLVILLLTISTIMVIRKIRKSEDRLLPQGRFSVRDIYEIIVEGVLNLLEDVVGTKKARHFLPLIGTIFILILTSNLIGIIPGFKAPTSNINTNAAYALTVFIATQYYGFKEHGLSYFKHFIGPVWWMAFMMIPLEILGHLVRPVTLSLRLFGNMNGDHMAVEIFSGMVPFLVPVVFLMFGVFVSFVQAFVFAILSLVYIALAIEED